MNKFSMRLAPVACAAGLLLTACGGGGGDSAPASPGVTASNYSTVAEPMAASVLSTLNVVDTIGSAVGGGEVAMDADREQRQVDPIALLKRAVARAASGREQAQQVEPFDEPCSGGGSIQGTVSFRNSDVLSAGDSISLTAHNCVAEGVTVNGGVDVAVNSYSAGTDSESGRLTLNFRGFSAAGASLSGGATLNFSSSASQANVSVGFNNATVSMNGVSLGLNYTTSMLFSGSQSTVSLSGNINLGEHDYALSQPAPFVLSGSGLASGTLQIREAAFGERVLLRADAGHFTYQYFSAGNTGGTPDHSSIGLAY